MHTSRLRQLPRALLPAARSPFGHTSQRVARFSTTVSRHSIQNPPLNTEKTGIPPPYAPVGVAAALEASPHISTPAYTRLHIPADDTFRHVASPYADHLRARIFFEGQSCPCQRRKPWTGPRDVHGACGSWRSSSVLRRPPEGAE